MTTSRKPFGPPRPAAAVMAAATALLVAACTAGSPQSDGGASPSDDATATASEEPLEIAWTADIDVFSGPVDADGTALVYVTQGVRIFLVGLDAGTGAELWRQEASPGHVVPGIAVTARVVDGHPVYFRPSDEGRLYAELVVADAESGEDVLVTDPYLYSSTPGACDDDTAVCLDARTTYDDQRESYRVAIDGNGDLERVDDLAGRAIGSDGLREVRDDGVEHLARFGDDGSELWRQPVAEVFGEGYSSDNGWAWDYDAAADVFYGYVGPSVERVDGEQTVAAQDLVTAGLDGTTGEVLWTDAGTRAWCFGAVDEPTDGDGPAVRCRVTGSKTFVEDGDPRSDGVTVTVEGFDVATGETVWERPADPADGLLGFFAPTVEGDPLRWAGASSVAVGGSEPVALDVTTGKTTPLEEQSLWCRAAERETVEYHEPFSVDGERSFTRLGSMLESRCDLDGDSDGTAAEAVAVPYGFGADVGDVRVVATPDGLVAFG